MAFLFFDMSGSSVNFNTRFSRAGAEGQLLPVVFLFLSLAPPSREQSGAAVARLHSEAGGKHQAFLFFSLPLSLSLFGESDGERTAAAAAEDVLCTVINSRAAVIYGPTTAVL